jgi:hypothetical protein
MMYSVGTNLVRYKITSGGYAIKVGDIVSYVRDINPLVMEAKILKCPHKQLVNKDAYLPKEDFKPMILIKRKTNEVQTR